MSEQAVRSYSEEQYLALERQAETRSEYFEGEIFAMGGASRQHNLIVGNVFAVLHAQLAGRDCEVYASDMRVRIPATGLHTYPDLAVVCGGPEFHDSELDTLINPTLIIEVLSESTADYDRGRKFGHYRTIESLAEYVLLEQDRVHVEQAIRQADGRWLLSEIEDRRSTVAFSSIDCELLLADAYARVLD